MTDEAFQLDISTLKKAAETHETPSEPDPRPWVGIHFECCGPYVRIYRDPNATAYHGACPHCGKPVTLRVGTEGVNARFFTAK